MFSVGYNAKNIDWESGAEIDQKFIVIRALRTLIKSIFVLKWKLLKRKIHLEKVKVTRIKANKLPKNVANSL